MNELNINDIKPLVDVSEYSLYFLITIITVLLILLVFIILFLIKKIKHKKVNYRKIYIQKLKDIDLEQSKDAAYTMTKYLNMIEVKEQYLQTKKDLLSSLTQYKYKKQTEQFDEKTKKLYQQLLDVL